MTYPAKIWWDADDKVFLVDFPDLEGCQTFGETLANALEMAQEAASGWIACQYETGRVVPDASKLKGKDIYQIEIAADVAMPITIRTMREAAGLTQAQMAQALGIKQPSYQRWEIPGSNITIKNLERVARALGKVLHVEIKSA